jgi:hypothetical protein
MTAIKIAGMACATALLITILTIYFSPYQSCVRAGLVKAPDPTYPRMMCAMRRP